ncbi:N-acetyltransferase [Candidatus Bathyarchaeota archaeon]|nr:MAG: N-acetyltransferase [Candidatus Bathyarchaeota archaeon]
METPSITTDRLRLRPVTETDIDFVFKLFSRTETNLYSEDPDIKSLKEAKEMYVRYMKPGSDTHFRVIIELTSTTEPIGTIGFYNYITDYRRAEMGYDLLKEYWGQGYMSEAVQAIIKYGFEELGLVRIEATVDPENIRSIKVLERNGFKHEGTLRKRYYYSGKWRDELFYGLIKE